MPNSNDSQSLPGYTPQALDIYKQTPHTTPAHTEEQVSRFIETVIFRRFSVSQKGGRLKKLMGCWKVAKKILEETQLDVFQLSREPETCYAFFEKHEFSLDYSQKVLRIFNAWGEFMGQEREKLFVKVPNAVGLYAQNINDAYRARVARDKSDCVSKQLNPRVLAKAQRKMKPEYYRWMYISLWMGLRPSEVDSLKKSGAFKIQELQLEKDGRSTTILKVYQSKLRNLPEARRWKVIPIMFPEQERALSYIRTGTFKRPRAQYIHTKVGRGYHLYAGRKGFANLLQTKGVGLELASAMLGHTSIGTTEKFYLDPVEALLVRLKASLK